MHNLTTATDSLNKGTDARPRILVSYGGGYAIKRLVLAPGRRFANCDPVRTDAAKALICQGVKLHNENTWLPEWDRWQADGTPINSVTPRN